MKQSVKVFLNLVFILILIGILFAYAMFQGGFVSWFLFSGFFPILIYHLAFILYPLKNWKITREFSEKKVRTGEEVTITIEVERILPFPIYYCLIEEDYSKTLNKLDYGRNKFHYINKPNKLKTTREVKKVIFPWFARKFRLEYTMEHLPRGKHYWHGARIKIGDIFGFVKKECFFQVNDELVVYPSSLPVHLDFSVSDLENGTFTSTNSFNQSTMAVGVRDYEPGDRFSWIDWKQSAKKNKIMSKEFEREKNSKVTVILDSTWHSEHNEIAYEATIELALGLIESFHKRNIHFDFLITQGTEEYYYIDQERDSKRRLLDYMTTLQPKGSHSLSIRLIKQMQRVKDGLIILITSHMDEELERTLQRLHRPVVILLIQSSVHSRKPTNTITGQWTREKITIHVLTEQDLVKNQLEVDVK